VKTYPIDSYWVNFVYFVVFLRKINVHKDGNNHGYWALVESRRTARGPEGRHAFQQEFFRADEPEWIPVNIKAVHTGRVFDFGDVWLAYQLIKKLALDEFRVIPRRRGALPWADLAMIPLIARFCEPRGELHIAEHFYAHSALPFLFGIPAGKIYENRLYRALDWLLPHKEALEKHLKERFGTLFQVRYDLLPYDITSSYFEGECKANGQAQRGYSRDKRPDCKQVLIALVVTGEGIPLGYEIFDGNRHDSTTVEEVVTRIEAQYGAADHIWVMDRGMISEKNIHFLKQGRRRYIVGTPKSMLKNFDKQLLNKEWHTIHEGVEVQYCPSPEGDETFILCCSPARQEKDRAIFERFRKNIEEGLCKIKQACDSGRLMQRNSRAARLFDISVRKEESDRISLSWQQRQEIADWVALTNGCYLLRSSITDWSAEKLWRAYIQLTEAEDAFRIHKGVFRLRPIWNQNKERVQAHIFVCFLAFVLWKTLAQMCQNAGPGHQPRKIVDELKHIKLTEVILPTLKGVEMKLYCVSKLDPDQKIILQRLKLNLPSRLVENSKM